VSGRIAYRAGDAVRHARFGVGEVAATGDGRVVVRFGTQERVFVPEIAPLTKIDHNDARVATATAVSVYGT
jgi:hypothetical protein